MTFPEPGAVPPIVLPDDLIVIPVQVPQRGVSAGICADVVPHNQVAWCVGADEDSVVGVARDQVTRARRTAANRVAGRMQFHSGNIGERDCAGEIGADQVALDEVGGGENVDTEGVSREEVARTWSCAADRIAGVTDHHAGAVGHYRRACGVGADQVAFDQVVGPARADFDCLRRIA